MPWPRVSRSIIPSCEHTFVSYVELHCHSAFSFLDGTALPEELVVAALERGHTALALTDHDGVYGSMEFAHAAKGLGLRAIQKAFSPVRSCRNPSVSFSWMRLKKPTLTHSIYCYRFWVRAV